MGYDLTLSGLLRKRAEMADELEALHTKASAMMADLNHIDATIRVFRPDIDLADLPEKIAPSPFSGFRGEIQRFLLDALRKANRPRSTFELADQVMEKRGLDPADRIWRSSYTPRRLLAGEPAERGQGEQQADASERAAGVGDYASVTELDVGVKSSRLIHR